MKLPWFKSKPHGLIEMHSNDYTGLQNLVERLKKEGWEIHRFNGITEYATDILCRYTVQVVPPKKK